MVIKDTGIRATNGNPENTKSARRFRAIWITLLVCFFILVTVVLIGIFSYPHHKTTALVTIHDGREIVISGIVDSGFFSTTNTWQEIDGAGKYHLSYMRVGSWFSNDVFWIKITDSSGDAVTATVIYDGHETTLYSDSHLIINLGERDIF